MANSAQDSTAPIRQNDSSLGGSGDVQVQQRQSVGQSGIRQNPPQHQQPESQQTRQTQPNASAQTAVFNTPNQPQSDQVNFGQQQGQQNNQQAQTAQNPQQTSRQANAQQPQQPRGQQNRNQQQTPNQQSIGQNRQQQNQRETELIPPNQQGQVQDPYYQDYPVGPMREELVYEWKAPSRPFKQHDRQYYTTVGTIVLLIALILFFAGQILPIAVVLAVGFLVYVMTSIPPHTIINQITTYGIRTGDNLYYWDELGRFWFKEKYDDEVMHVEVGRFPERLTLLIGEGKKELLREIMSLTLLEEEPPATYYERAAAWLQEKIPLDIEG